ncbi:MAG: Eco57I restriction-modification methylase domain-containing protein [Candidatus Symbiobacter sp.]|nr:Eco57I restriction-modification methylase domain-containing protein [Candidatus Symbiobacter sp.]
MIGGRLYTTILLRRDVAKTKLWADLEPNLSNFRARLQEIFATIEPTTEISEAKTEDNLIIPILTELGWLDYDRQIPADEKHRTDIPDLLLFDNAEDKKTALPNQGAEAYRHGLTFLEVKKWQRMLDRNWATEREVKFDDPEVPSSQMLRYMSAVARASNYNIEFSMLSNGRQWRIYWNRARSKAEEYFEVDLPVLLGLTNYDGGENILGELPGIPAIEPGSDHALMLFYVLFNRRAFASTQGRMNFLEEMVLVARNWEQRVSEQLAHTILTETFPRLVRDMARADELANPGDEEWLEELRIGAMILLYRLLFVIYAEDRGLLPMDNPYYFQYSLRNVRKEIDSKSQKNTKWSKEISSIYPSLRLVFNAIDKGSSELKIPSYNGGLFDESNFPIVDRIKLSDFDSAALIQALSVSRESDDTKQEKIWLNFRDLSVQHLGGIYENLLEKRLVLRDGIIAVEKSIFSRKDSGSYYTPEILVQLVIDQTVGELVQEKIQNFADAVAIGQDNTELAKIDPAIAILDLKICDPAMGSGHFLVSLVDYLCDKIIEAMTEVERQKPGYKSHLATEVNELRKNIIDEAAKFNVQLDDKTLDDKQIVRRFVLKRNVYGVDKNPMAVDLAKVSLWLHSFTIGAPLSFLDHHIICGDSLFGEWVGDLLDKSDLFIHDLVKQSLAAIPEMMAIETTPDASVADVKFSSEHYLNVRAKTKRLARLLDLVHIKKWLSDKSQMGKVQHIIDNPDYGRFKPGDKSILEKYLEDEPQTGDNVFNQAFATVRQLQRSEHFTHWQIAFPGVWTDWGQKQKIGGFDAVIGNPPWDRMKLQQVEWFAERDMKIASQPRASDRKKLIDAEKNKKTVLYKEYLAANQQTETASEIARHSKDYKLLSGGDINIYSLFVERAQSLTHAKGMIGLVTPSGIYADHTASRFFKSISTTGRLKSLFDFENRAYNIIDENKRTDEKPQTRFFPDVHPQFKFCVINFGGPKRTFAAIKCGFMLTAIDVLSTKEKPKDVLKHERVLSYTAQDFDLFNPNTGTAAIIYNQRILDITRAIFAKNNIINRHLAEGEVKPYPIKQKTLFHMTNDSGLFKTKAELISDGFYFTNKNVMKKGKIEYSPLYVGKMIHHFDHRFNSVGVNPDNLHVNANSIPTTQSQHQDPKFNVTPQYWVNKDDYLELTQGLKYYLGFRDITNATNERTMIATVIPAYPCGNKIPLLMPMENVENYSEICAFLSANFSSFMFDFCARVKVQGTNINWYILEQLPVIPPDMYQRKFGELTAGELVTNHVVELTYTAHDLEDFARDLGYGGPPFAWDVERRRHLRARLDALYFHLYGLSYDDAAYVMTTFPIVQKNDEAEFNGHFLTRDLILAYYNALAAGDAESVIQF